MHKFNIHRPLYYFGIIATVLLCTACSHTEDIAPETDANIGFGVALSTNGNTQNSGNYTSRATVTNSEPLKNGISVWGGYEDKTVFDDRIVYWGQDANGIGEWTYEHPEIWTFNTYNFLSLYPSTAHAAYNVNVSDNCRQLSIEDFDTAPNHDTDLLQASIIGLDGSMHPRVNLSFQHILTNINVALNKHPDNATDAIAITQVYLLNIYTKGNYTWEYNNAIALWNTDETSGINLGKVFSTNNQLSTDKYTPFLTDQLLIPQTVDPDQHPIVLVVVYDYTITAEDNSKETIKNNILYATLPAEQIWDCGKKITYKATIKANKDITFAVPTVEEWGSEQVGGTIIIK